ncbi:hypothetical protein G6O67_002000 [Ophiocordyceps sinensis]|uniref:Uncharacterized protein n=1 Tax=Ophiocordyceps sinensis TaxID=72228 RepID=A0A8H4V722_9HYPO|nr:hypothetical protein G6O67_002000 [Ophiocordyceps sinensis]
MMQYSSSSPAWPTTPIYGRALCQPKVASQSNPSPAKSSTANPANIIISPPPSGTIFVMGHGMLVSPPKLGKGGDHVRKGRLHVSCRGNMNARPDDICIGPGFDVPDEELTCRRTTPELDAQPLDKESRSWST